MALDRILAIVGVIIGIPGVLVLFATAKSSDAWFRRHPELQPWADGIKYNVYRDGVCYGEDPALEWWHYPEQ